MRLARVIFALFALAAPSAALAQATLLQGGPSTPGHAPIYVSQGNGQPIVQDSGPAGGGGQGLGLSEWLQVARSPTNTYPSSNSGTGPFATHGCMYDAPATNPTGYHYLCFDPNASGGGVIAYGAIGSAPVQPLYTIINGVQTILGGGGGTSALTIGTTPVNGAPNGYLLFNNNGLLGATVGSTLVPGATIIAPANNGGILYDNNGLLGDSKTMPSGITHPNPILTGDILLQPTFTGANPGSAGIYGQLANPANGYTGIWNGGQFSLGTAIPTTSQFGAGTVPIQQGFVFTTNIQSGDTAGNGGYALSAYGRSFSTTTGAQGMLGIGMCAIESAPLCEGGNFGISNGTIFNGNSFTGFDFQFAATVESDANLMKVSGGADPTGALYGFYATGAGNITGPLGTAYGCDVLSQTTNAKWANCFLTTAGAAVNGYVAGPAGKGNGVGSQSFLMENTSAGAVLGFAEMLSDASSNIDLIPAIGVGGVVALQDGLGNTIAETTPTAFIVSKAASLNNGATVTTSFTATGLVTLVDLATQSANTVVGNATSGAASPTALAVGSCSTASSALIWTTNSGFGCNTSITANSAPAANLTGTTLASNVVTSSLTTVGIIQTGTWNATLIGPTYGGTGVNNGSNALTVPATGTADLLGTVQTISAAKTFSGQIISTFGAPTIANGACGTGTNGTISGSNQSGIVTIGAATTTTCAVSFSTTITAPNACTITPGNAAAAATGTTVARVGTPSGTAWTITGSALANTVYSYVCL